MRELLVRLQNPSRGMITIFGVIGVFLVIYAGIAYLRFQEQKDSEAVVDEIELLLPLLQRQPEDLTSLEQESKATREIIPDDLRDTDIYRFVRGVAARSSVEIRKNSVNAPTSIQVGSTSYTLIKSQLSAAGTYDDLRAFVLDMETQTELPTLVVEKAQIDRTDPDSSLSLDYLIYVLPTG